MEITGGCLCGDVRYRATGEPLRVAHCHCRNCQRASGSAFLTYVALRAEDLEWAKGQPTIYESSPGVERGFCGRCGSSMTFARPDRGEISVFAGTLDEPHDIEPQFHIFTDHQFSWLRIADDKPGYARFARGYEDRDTG